MHRHIDKGIWLGNEAEGKHRELLTLFIKGEVSWGQIKAAIDSHAVLFPAPRFWRRRVGIYFCAGRDSRYDKEAVIRALKYGFKVVTLELRATPHDWKDIQLYEISGAYYGSLLRAGFTRHEMEQLRVVLVLGFKPTDFTIKSVDAVKFEFGDEEVFVFEKEQDSHFDLTNPLLNGDTLLWVEGAINNETI